MRRTSAALTGMVLLLAACAPAASPSRASDEHRGDLRASAAELYRQYGMAISAPRREALAGFYSPVGAIRVINGTRRELTRGQLDSVYRGPWNPPEYFAWEELTYDSIGVGRVVVTGGFRWKARGDPDTTRFLYAALLEAADSGMTIRVEVETARPPR